MKTTRGKGKNLAGGNIMGNKRKSGAQGHQRDGKSGARKHERERGRTRWGKGKKGKNRERRNSKGNGENYRPRDTRELKMETFSGRRQLQPDVTS